MSNSRNRGDSASASTEVTRNPDAQSPSASRGNASGPYSVIGEGGKTRHIGYFGDNNPYFNNLKVAANNQDRDALYELAVQWEADYANRQMQLEENQQILEEQRAYDSPLAQTQRMRAAGINPDLEGSSIGSGSGSGSAQLANPGMADQTGQTKFNNSYDNTAQVFEGINTAANFAGALTSGVSNIMNAVSNFKMLPSQIALNEANAGLSKAKANEINELLAGKKKGVDLSNVAQGIQNSTATLQQLAQFSQLIAPDTKDFAPYLNALGVPEAQIPAYTDMIKQMHANPKMRDQYAKAETSARWSEAENDTYTEQLVGEMTDLQAKITYEQKHWQFHTTRLQSKISKLLDTDALANQMASNEIEKVFVEGNALGVKTDQLNLYAQQLKHDTATFLQGLTDRAKVLADADTTLEALRKQPKSPQRDAQINRIIAEKVAVRQLLSTQFNELKFSYLAIGQQIYANQTILESDNLIKDEGARSKYNYFLDLTFNDLVYHTRTPGQIANDWVDSAINALGVAVDAAGVARGFDFNTTYRDVHGGAARQSGYNQGWSAAENYYNP